MALNVILLVLSLRTHLSEICTCKCPNKESAESMTPNYYKINLQVHPIMLHIKKITFKPGLGRHASNSSTCKAMTQGSQVWGQPILCSEF
jgi:hypothetical protein